jgi:glucan phosphoethanolaminetransferase (alkaline phosphatase superfamily)
MNFYIIEILVVILSFVFFFILTTFIVDGFRFSDNYWIRKLEINLFYLLVALIIIIIVMLNTQVVHAAGPENIDPTSVINSTATNSAKIGVSGTVVIDANGAKVLAEAGKKNR